MRPVRAFAALRSQGQRLWPFLSALFLGPRYEQEEASVLGLVLRLGLTGAASIGIRWQMAGTRFFPGTQRQGTVLDETLILRVSLLDTALGHFELQPGSSSVPLEGKSWQC